MPVAINQLHPVFAAEIIGLDVTRPDEALRRQVTDAMDRYAVVVLRDQFIEDDQQVAFTRLFGPLEMATTARGNRKMRQKAPEIFDVSNIAPDGGLQKEDDVARIYRLANELWHTDSSFRQVSATYSLLSGRVVPPSGGDTEFADLRAAYDALPDALRRRVAGLEAEHSIWVSRARYGYIPTEQERNARPPAHHPMVRVHPGSKRSTLYIASHISRILGLSEAEGGALLTELLDFATQPAFVYAHKWRTGDLVIWDNRCTMHRATSYADGVHVRDMRRTTVKEQEMAAA